MEPGDLIADRYRLVEEIGGGHSVVFSASHIFLHRDVAIKVLPSMHARDVQRFESESRLLGRLRHPNVVEVYDAGTHTQPGSSMKMGYIAMERLRGETLKARLSDGQRLTLPEVTELLQPILRALSYLHGHGIMHRDVKPSNVFLANDSSGPLAHTVPKLLDFGLSSRIHVDGLTSARAGTARYLSPEHMDPSVAIDERVDIWATGVMLYQMLTGRLPFRGGRHEVIMQIVAGDPAPPSALVTTLPRAIDEVVLGALTKKRDDRIGSVDELLRLWNRAAGARNWKSGTYRAKSARVDARVEAREATPLLR